MRNKSITPSVLLFLGLAGVVCGGAFGASPHPSKSNTTSAQWCVNRWGQLDMHPTPTLAVVLGRKKCTILLGYSTRKPSSGCRADTTGYGHFCVDPASVFRCRLNQQGAYDCWTHAGHLRHPRWNARVGHDHRLVLDHPQQHVRTPTPSWARRYPVDRGYIKPWTKAGRLRGGLKFVDHHTADSCDPGSAVIGGAWRCNDRYGAFGADPCFPQPGRKRLFACATAPGSTRFLHVTARHRM